MSALMRPALFSMPFRQENVKLLRYLGGRTKNFEFSNVLQARFIVSDQCSRDDINALIDLYTKREAHHVSNQMPGHFQTDEVVRLFKSMVSDHDESCPPNEYISGLVLSSCLNIGHLFLGRQCHGYLLKSGLVINQYMKTALVRLCSMLSDVVGAMEVLLCNRGLDTRSCNLILVGLVEKGYLDEALIMSRRMLAEDLAWNKATYIGIFDLCARLKDVNLGRQVHNKLLKSDDAESDEFVRSALINMYGKCGEILSAKKVFDRFQHRDVVIWTAMLAAYLEQGSFEESLTLFSHMQHEDVVPNESTFCVLLNVSAASLSNRCGKSFQALAVKFGFKGHKNFEDALINMYSRTGDIRTAERLFLGMTRSYRDIVTWNTMICGYSLHGYGKKSLALFQEMLRSGEDPNSDTFVGVLNACGQMGLVEQGFYYFYELMKQKGVEPGLDHYMCVINMLIKAGQLNEALSFIVSTPSKWDAFAWTTLLSACHARRNYTLGTRVVELIPDDVATKVCGVTQVRELMEIKQECGESWVEIRDTTFKFPTLDEGYPNFEGLRYAMQQFRRSINFYLEKWHPTFLVDADWDSYHSEELAAGVAIMKSENKAPIFVIKTSGKICDHCHSFMKSVSKSIKKSITVRDAYQFHNFHNGRCSCADYW